jgi:hypothetical protein
MSFTWAEFQKIHATPSRNGTASTQYGTASSHDRANNSALAGETVARVRVTAA